MTGGSSGALDGPAQLSRGRSRHMRAMSIGEPNSWQLGRTLFFISLMLVAGGLVSLSFTYLPRVLEEPHLFALLFSLGSVSAVGALAMRTGPSVFVQSRLTRAERPFTAIYATALLGTLHGAVSQSYLSTVFFAAAQFAVLMCRLEGLISLHDGRERGSGPPSGAACASCGSRQWNTMLQTKHQHDAYSTRFESLNYDEVSSDLQRNRSEDDRRYGFSADEAAVGRWVLTALCGISIGLVAFVMTKTIEELTHWKMMQVTNRIKVEFMMETGGLEDVPLWNASHKVTEHLVEALDFKYDEYCWAIKSKAQCGDLTHGDPHCYWDDEEEIARDGSCDEAAPCCVEKEGSPLLFFLLVNTGLALLASLPVVLFAPEAAGSGIPEVMGYLNGVHIRKMLRMRTLIAKVWGTVMVVSSGMALGPEGPMIHSGAVIGSVLTRSNTDILRSATVADEQNGDIENRYIRSSKIRNLGFFALFNNDIDRRDFMSMGAAAGFAAAFGAPVGGVLFALEEASSFWNTKLMWRLLLCTSLSCFTLSFCRNLEMIERGEATGNFQFEPGMLTFNSNKKMRFKHQWELLLCCLLGAMTGVLGAIFNKLVAWLAYYRPKQADTIVFDESDERSWAETWREILWLLRQHSFRIGEVVAVSLLTSCVTFGLPWIGAYFGFACQVESDEIVESENITGVEYATYPFFCETTWDPAKGSHCAERGCRQYNDMATIFLSSRENSILSLIEHPQAFSARSLALISISFFLLMVISFGAALPGGIFMPTIVVGCTFGALFGRFAKYFSCLLDQVEGGCMAHDPFGQSEHGGSGIRLDDVGFSPHLGNVIVHTGPYALLGAVGLLGGIQRSSVSLVVIIVEGTGKVDYLLPIIFTTVCAKWVGDKLNDGIYHTLHVVKGIPFLENEPSKRLQQLTAQDLMHSDPVCLQTEVQVREVRDLLHTVNRPLLNKLHGFPVVQKVTIREVRPKQKQAEPSRAAVQATGSGGPVAATNGIPQEERRQQQQEQGDDDDEDEAERCEEVTRTLQVYQGMILVDGLCSLLRTKRFYRRRHSRSRYAAGAPGLELVNTAEDASVDSNNGEGGWSGTENDDDEGGYEGDYDSQDLEMMEMQPLQRIPPHAGFTTAAAAPKESPARTFARKTLAALKKRADAADMIVEEALLQLENHELDLWVDIGEAMNRAAYHVLADTPAHKVHRLFRTMGLRHLVVTDQLNDVKGIVTRSDLIHHQH